MDKLQKQATAYLLSKELPSELVEKLHNHKYNTMFDLITVLVNQELESWQYCYIHHYEPTDKRIPEYIVQSIDTDRIQKHIQDLVSSETPLVSQNTPFDRNPQVVEASGGREQYCEQQIKMYQDICAKSLSNTVWTLLEQNSRSSDQLDSTKLFNLSQEFVEEIGIWDWYILTQKTPTKTIEEGTYEGDAVPRWCIKKERQTFVQLLEEYDLIESIDLSSVKSEIRSFENIPSK